jgi:L-alanine-DL-glutamate epimerase-like enolase superfamily enzyme
VTAIRSITATPLDARLRRPFGIAGGAQEVARNVLVRLELDDGTVGYGEGAPFPAFNGETQEATLAAIEGARHALVGGRAVTSGAFAVGSAQCAVEMALLDAQARGRNEPIFRHGGRTLTTDVTIPIGPLDECTADAHTWAARGFTRLKVKIGGAGLDDALARVLAVHAAAPRAELLLDGNAGMTAKEAIALLRELASRDVTTILFEQPVAKDDLDGLAEVARASDVLVAADESAASLRDVERLARWPRLAPLVINVKPMKYGFHEAAAIHAFARAHGLGLMIGGMVEGKMSMTASACFAAALGGFDYVDLDTPLFLADEPFDGGFVMNGETIELATIRAGHACTPARTARVD